MSDKALLRVALVLATATGGIGQHVRSLATRLPEALSPLNGHSKVAVTVLGPSATEELFGFTALGAEFASLEIGVRLRPGADISTVRRLRGLAREFDVVHAHGLRAGSLAALALGRFSPRPGSECPRLVVTWHNKVFATGINRVVLAALERHVARSADVTLGASADLVELARRRGARDARLCPVAAPELPPATQSREQIRASLGVADRPLVLAVGRLAPQKGYPILLNAAHGWRQQNPAPLVLIAGEGPERAVLQERIDAENLPVRLLGHRADVSDLLAAADVVVLPSGWEARALIAQEALRAGRPLVATAVGDVPDLVGEAALLIPYGDVAALSQAVIRVLADPDQAARLATIGPRQAASWPTESDTVTQVATIYSELLKSRG